MSNSFLPNFFSSLGTSNNSEVPKKIILTKSEFYKNLENYTLDEILKLDNPDIDSCLFTKLEMLYALLNFTLDNILQSKNVHYSLDTKLKNLDKFIEGKEHLFYQLSIDELQKKLRHNVLKNIYDNIISKYNKIQYGKVDPSGTKLFDNIINKSITLSEFIENYLINNEIFIPVKHNRNKKIIVDGSKVYKKNENKDKKLLDYSNQYLAKELFNIIKKYDYVSYNLKDGDGQTKNGSIYKNFSDEIEQIKYYYQTEKYGIIIIPNNSQTPIFVSLKDCLMFYSIIELTIEWPWQLISNKINNGTVQEYYHHPEKIISLYYSNQNLPKNFPKNIRDIIEKIYELVKPKCIQLNNLIKKYNFFTSKTTNYKIYGEMKKENLVENCLYILYYNFKKKEFVIPYEKNLEKNKNGKDIFNIFYRPISKINNFIKVVNSKSVYVDSKKIFNLISFNKENCKNNNNENNFKKKFMSIFINEIKKYPDIITSYSMLTKFSNNNIENIISKIINNNNITRRLKGIKNQTGNKNKLKILNYSEFKEELKKLVIEEIKKYPQKYSKLINRNNLSNNNIKNINKHVKNTLIESFKEEIPNKFYNTQYPPPPPLPPTPPPPNEGNIVNMSNATIAGLIDNLKSNPSEYEIIIRLHNKSLRLQNIFKIIYEINKSKIEENIKNDIIRHLMIKLSNYKNYKNSNTYYSYYIDLLIDDLIKNPDYYANIIEKFKKLIESNRISNQDLIDRIINILGFTQYTNKMKVHVKNKLISNLKTIVPNFRNFKQLEYIKTTTGLGSIFGKRKKNTVQIKHNNSNKNNKLVLEIIEKLQNAPRTFIGILDKYNDELIQNIVLVYKLIYNIYMESTLEVRYRNGSIDKLFYLSDDIKNNQNFFYNYIALFINYLIKNQNISNENYNNIFSKFKNFITYYYSLAYNKDYGIYYQQTITYKIINYIDNKLKNSTYNDESINKNFKTDFDKLSPEIKNKLRNSLVELNNSLPQIFNNINKKN